MSQTRGFSLGWMLVSYFMIAGGFMLSVGLVGLFRIQSSSEVFGYAVFFFGAAVGGFFAGRASPGETILEPALGGVMLFLSFFALAATVPAVRALWSIADESAVARAALLGLVIGVGGLAGGLLGEKTSGGVQSRSTVRWMGVSALINLGMMFFLMMVFGILLLRHAASGGSLSEDASGGMVVALLALTAFLGGAITQACAPVRLLVASGLGFVVVVVVIMGLMASLSGGDVRGNVYGGMAIFAVLGLAVGIAGAAVGWALVRGRRLSAGPQVGQVFE